MVVVVLEDLGDKEEMDTIFMNVLNSMPDSLVGLSVVTLVVTGGMVRDTHKMQLEARRAVLVTISAVMDLVAIILMKMEISFLVVLFVSQTGQVVLVVLVVLVGLLEIMVGLDRQEQVGTLLAGVLDIREVLLVVI